MATIVVGLDGSELSRVAFREAVQEAQWRDADVLALHVTSYTRGYEFGGIDTASLHALGEALIATELKELREGYGGTFPVAVESAMRVGHVGVEIIEAARDVDGGAGAELVVLGSRGMGGFRGLLLGSVSTYAVHHLPHRLLIVRDEESAA